MNLEVTYVPQPALAGVLDPTKSPSDIVMPQIPANLWDFTETERLNFVVISLLDCAVEQIGPVDIEHGCSLLASPSVTSPTTGLPEYAPSARVKKTGNLGDTITAFLDPPPPGCATVGVWSFRQSFSLYGPAAAVHLRCDGLGVDVLIGAENGPAFSATVAPADSAPAVSAWFSANVWGTDDIRQKDASFSRAHEDGTATEVYLNARWEKPPLALEDGSEQTYTTCVYVVLAPKDPTTLLAAE